MKRLVGIVLAICLMLCAVASAEVFSASSQGMGGEVAVEVDYTDGAIVSIKVVKQSETAGLGDIALDKLAKDIVETQNIGLDAVSGATVSSTALLKAVEDCLTQAGADVESFKTISETKEAPAGEQIELEVDFAVIGAGPAGLTAAIAAAENGASVVVFEKTASTGGAAARGMGILAIGTKLQEAQGEPMNVDEAYNMFMEYTHYRTDGVLVRKYFERSNDTLMWIEDMGVEFEEAARYFSKSYPSWHIVKSDDGVKGGGQAATMTRKMTEHAKELGVEFYLNTPATSVTLDEQGKVNGVTACSADSGDIYKVTCDAALIATGGFGDDVDRIKDELGYTYGVDYFGMRLPGHDGDGINMAYAVGAGHSDVNIEMISSLSRLGSQGWAAGTISGIVSQPNLLVNLNGERFFNEEQVQNTTFFGNALAQQSNNQGFMILTEAIKNDYMANGVPFTSRVSSVKDFSSFDVDFSDAVANGLTSVVKYDTVDELAADMGINVENLQKTIVEYNEICANAYDPMGKSAEYLIPIGEGPYYAASYFPGCYGTLGGIKINSSLQVVTDEDVVIPGLYSAGTDSCTIYADSYMFLLPGNTMGYAVNSGRMAGENAAAYCAELK